MRLRYTLPALADLTSILDYIAERSPQGVARVHSRIRAVTDLILRYPLDGAVTDDPTIRRITTMPYPYLIFYEATDAEIVVHAVRPTALAILPTRYDRSEFSQNDLQVTGEIRPLRRRFGCRVIAPPRNNSAHLHRPWRATKIKDWVHRQSWLGTA